MTREQEWEELYVKHRFYFLAIAGKIVCNRETAEEVVQTAFMKAWKCLDSFGRIDGASMKTWLYSIVVNESLQSLRKPREVLSENLDLSYTDPHEQQLMEADTRSDRWKKINKCRLARAERQVANQIRSGMYDGTNNAAKLARWRLVARASLQVASLR